VTRGLLDTSVLIDPPPPEALPDESLVSVLSLGELEIGVLLAHGSAERSARLARLTGVREAISALPVDEAVTHAYALLVAQARESGRNPRVIDTLIAATARAHGLPLYTRDLAQADLAGIQAVRVAAPSD
jgi:predicted nucleic acid-binding protein